MPQSTKALEKAFPDTPGPYTDVCHSVAPSSSKSTAYNKAERKVIRTTAGKSCMVKFRVELVCV